MKRPIVFLLVLLSLLAAVMAAESCSSFSPHHCTTSRGCSWCASENQCFPIGADCPVDLSECAYCTLDGDYYCTTETDAFCTSRAGCDALRADVKSCDLHANTAACTQCLDIPNAVWCPDPGSFCFSKLDKAAAQTCKQLTGSSATISDPPACAIASETCSTCLLNDGVWCDVINSCISATDSDSCSLCEAKGGVCRAETCEDQPTSSSYTMNATSLDAPGVISVQSVDRLGECVDCIVKGLTWCLFPGVTTDRCLADDSTCTTAGGYVIESCNIPAYSCYECVILDSPHIWCPENAVEQQCVPAPVGCDGGATYWSVTPQQCVCIGCVTNDDSNLAAYCDGDYVGCYDDPFECQLPLTSPVTPQMCMTPCTQCFAGSNLVCVSPTNDPYCVADSTAGAARCSSHGGVLVDNCDENCETCTTNERAWCIRADDPDFQYCAQSCEDGDIVVNAGSCAFIDHDECGTCTNDGGEWCVSTGLCMDSEATETTCPEDPVTFPCECLGGCVEGPVEDKSCVWCVFADDNLNHYTETEVDCLTEGGYAAKSCGCGLECQSAGGICCVSCEGEDICVSPGDSDRCILDDMVPIGSLGLYSAIPCLECLCADDEVYCPDALMCVEGDFCDAGSTVAQKKDCFTCEQCVLLNEYTPARFCAESFSNIGCVTNQWPSDSEACNEVFCEVTCETCVDENHVWCTDPDRGSSLCTTADACSSLGGIASSILDDCHPSCCEECADDETCECECVPICPYDQCDECIADPLCSWCGAEVTERPGRVYPRYTRRDVQRDAVH
ncbi:hypothetical protein J8273_5265 [Carpediemonas membranifera]|uniref:TNFR-Cys domain-containing protein n=1 Tax=Carpediemonas membranifera TaxID=201153 RepID=A0A8J6E0U3_9EUKA|nr:hypothetical protein J8273_5265 [Carpediemonas membranifera]|eukprot:KAG9392276.1 hypothetical protein J8273_5265 [Carpediemonas membranifera]